MNRASFFAALRARGSGVFGTSLSQRQVDGTDALLDALRGFPLDHAAHVLGEVYHETGGGMFPVKETVMPYHKDKNPPDDEVIRRLDKAWAAGKLKGVKEPYWRAGWFGRGFLQATHRENYAKAAALTGHDLVGKPWEALDLRISAEIAAEGCRVGMFTGKKLSDFDGDPYDHFNARAIVNGDKGRNGTKVADYAMAFAKALQAAGWGVRPHVLPDVEPTPVSRSGGLWAAIINAIFGGRQ